MPTGWEVRLAEDGEVLVYSADLFEGYWNNEEATRSVFGADGFPAMYFIEQSYAGDPTNWWIPNRACAEAMLRSAGFEITDHPEEEVFICRRREAPYGAGAVYPAGRSS